MIENKEAAALEIILLELQAAMTKHPKFCGSAYQAVSLIAEELGELAQAVNGDDPDWEDKAVTEAAHVAVTAIRTIQFIQERAEE